MSKQLIIFLLGSYLFIGVIFLIMPKRLTKQEIYITWLIVTVQTLIADIFLGEILDLYDLIKDEGDLLIDLIIQITLPAFFGILYMNFMPREKIKFIVYFVFWVFFSVTYETLSVFVGYVNYKGWNIWYTIIFYIYACLYMRWHYWFIHRGNKNHAM
ncbi:hypothetical protein [Niallia sp.]|uniref:hypothetical protein n=1 Tax=Niallia sp. TaxID=2837523 RepID=UPI0028A0DBF9|nr:hypothetical protein [Niallia sp.]